LHPVRDASVDMGCIPTACRGWWETFVSTERCIPDGIQFGEIENISYNIIYTLFPNETTLVSADYTPTPLTLFPYFLASNVGIAGLR